MPVSQGADGLTPAKSISVAESSCRTPTKTLYRHPPLPSPPLPSPPVPSRPLPSPPVPSRPVPSRPVPSPPLPSHLIQSYPLQSGLTSTSAACRPAWSNAPCSTLFSACATIKSLGICRQNVSLSTKKRFHQRDAQKKNRRTIALVLKCVRFDEP